MTPHGDDRSRLPVVRSAVPVAHAYLDPLIAGDCTATSRLLAVGGGRAPHDPCGIGHVDTYRDLVGPAGSNDDLTFGVTLILRDMPRISGWPDGDATVFLNLVRETGGPWRVIGVGSGP